MGGKLFERDRRKTVLTAAGAAFQNEASGVLAQLDQAIQSARLALRGKMGVLRIGFHPSAGINFVPRLIREYRALNPRVTFSLRSMRTAHQVRMLEEGSLDLGFLWMPFVSGRPSLEVALIQQEPWILAVPASHSLAKKSAVRLGETADETYVLSERTHSPAYHDFVLGTLNRAGIIPRIFEFTGETTTALSLIAAGVGISLLNESAVKTSAAAVAACKVLDKNVPAFQTGLAWRKTQTSTIVQQFKKFVLMHACSS